MKIEHFLCKTYLSYKQRASDISRLCWETEFKKGNCIKCQSAWGFINQQSSRYTTLGTQLQYVRHKISDILMGNRNEYPFLNMKTPTINHTRNWTFLSLSMIQYPDSKVHGANVGPIWGRQEPGGPHVGSMNFAIWVLYLNCLHSRDNRNVETELDMSPW